MKTKSGKHTIFDITGFLPGKPIPPDYFHICDGPWYFRPSDWEAPTWGTNIGELQGFPMCYSPGFATEEEALKAAEAWETERRTGEKQEAAFMKWLNGG